MSEIVITVIGRDRAGAVADVSSALAGLGLNLTDSSMTLLRGHFAMTLVCADSTKPPRAEQGRAETRRAEPSTAEPSTAEPPAAEPPDASQVGSAASGEVDLADVQSALAPLCADGRLVATVRRVEPERAFEGAGRPYTLSVHGADRLGIVAAVTGVLAEVGGNITDLSTRLAGDLYVLGAEVDLPDDADVPALTAALDEVASGLGVEISLRPADADVL